MAAAIGGVWWAGRDTPEKAVQRYFEAAGRTPDKLAETVTNAPASTSGPQPLPMPETIKLQDATAHGTRVTAHYTVTSPRGDERSDQVELETRLVGDQYKVVDGFPTLRVSGQLPVMIGYAEIRVPTTIALLPGSYQISAKDRPDAVVLGDPVVTIRPGESRTLTTEQRLSDDGAQWVRARIQLAFQSCLGKSDPAPTGCPFRVDRPADQKQGSTGTWMLPGSSDDPARLEVTAEAGQPLNKACAVVVAHPMYQYWSNHPRPNPQEPDPGLPDQVQAASDHFVGCLDLTGTSRDKISWRS